MASHQSGSVLRLLFTVESDSIIWSLMDSCLPESSDVVSLGWVICVWFLWWNHSFPFSGYGALAKYCSDGKSNLFFSCILFHTNVYFLHLWIVRMCLHKSHLFVYLLWHSSHSLVECVGISVVSIMTRFQIFGWLFQLCLLVVNVRAHVQYVMFSFGTTMHLPI